MKRILATVCMVLLAGAAFAGDKSSKQMDAMKAEMSKCAVCKHMVPYLDQVSPIKTEVVDLNNGMALIHTVSDDKAEVFHKAGAECAAAGAKAMELSDTEAKTQLCALCQGVRSAAQSGATVSKGNTKDGDIMILTSNDAKVQMHLSELADKCAMMMDAQATR